MYIFLFFKKLFKKPRVKSLHVIHVPGINSKNDDPEYHRDETCTIEVIVEVRSLSLVVQTLLTLLAQ